MRHWDGKDYYAILAVHPADDHSTIRRSYQAHARAFHPDLAGPEGEERMKAVTEAWSVLSRHRAEYDEHLRLVEVERRRRHAQEQAAAQARSRAAEQAARAQREAIDRAEAERRRREAHRAQSVRRVLDDPHLELGRLDALVRELWMSAFAPTRGADVLETIVLGEDRWRSGVELSWPRGWPGPVSIPPLLGAGWYLCRGLGAPGAFGGPRGDLHLEVRHVDARGVDVPGGFRPARRGRVVSALRTAWSAVTLVVVGSALGALLLVLGALAVWVHGRL